MIYITKHIDPKPGPGGRTLPGEPAWETSQAEGAIPRNDNPILSRQTPEHLPKPTPPYIH